VTTSFGRAPRATAAGGRSAARGRVCGAALVLIALGGCYRGAAELSASGKGLPQVSVEFPHRTAPGSVHTSMISVTNPGPGDIERVTVAFARVGAPASEGLPRPIVGGSRGSGGVVSVMPRPSSVSPDGVVYRFGPLQEGGSESFEFRLEVPSTSGVAANSVTVYDDVDPDRARGARLETTVEG
jgi:hypothetical protein